MRIPQRLRRKPPLPKRPVVTATPLCPGRAFPFARVFDAVALNARNARKPRTAVTPRIGAELATDHREARLVCRRLRGGRVGVQIAAVRSQSRACPERAMNPAGCSRRVPSEPL
jgi:hypothetical protein